MKQPYLKHFNPISYIKYLTGSISFFFFLIALIVLFMKIDSLYPNEVLSHSVKDLNKGYDFESWIKKPLLRFTNSSGFFSKMYRGESHRIAFFSGCTFTRSNLLFDELSSYFEDTYIENYSRDSMHCKPVIQKLKKLKHHYKFIFISTSCLIFDEATNFPIEVLFPSNTNILFDIVVKSFEFSVKRFIEKLLNSFSKSFFPHSNKNPYPDLSQKIRIYKKQFKTIPVFDKKDRHIRRFYRNNNLIDFYSVDQKELPENRKNLVKKEFQELLVLAQKKAEKVYFITIPISYDEEELPSVSLKWHLIYALENRGELASKDNSSVAYSHRLENHFMSDLAKEMGGGIIDLDSFLRKKLKYTDQLFADQMYLTPKGVKVSIDYILDQIK